eukprot:355039-Rhodomonas_salina.1
MLLLHLPAEYSDIDMVTKIMAEIARLQNLLFGEDPRKRHDEIDKLTRDNALHLGKDLESCIARTLVMIMALISIYMEQGAVYHPTLDLLVQRNKKDLKFNAPYGKEISRVIKEVTHDLCNALNEIMDLHREDVLATIRSKLHEASTYISTVFEKISDLQEYKRLAREIVDARSNRKRKPEHDEDRDEEEATEDEEEATKDEANAETPDDEERDEEERDEEEPDNEEPDEDECDDEPAGARRRKRRKVTPTWQNDNICMANLLAGRGKHPQAPFMELLENISQQPVEAVSGKRRRTV